MLDNIATASVLNVILMRNQELSVGIAVTNAEGAPIGNSKVAAKQVSMVWLGLLGLDRLVVLHCDR